MAKILAKGRFKDVDYCVTQGPLGSPNGYFIAPNSSDSAVARKLVAAYKDLDKWSHGGITYQGFGNILNDDELFLTNDVMHADFYVLGFDTAHYGDYVPAICQDGQKWSVQDVVDECKWAISHIGWSEREFKL